MISVLLVGVLFVAAMNLVGASKFSQYKTADRQRGNLLAQALMAEILSQAYEEPVDTVNFGRESSESGGDRADWDDVDDYDGWSSSPPEYKDGTPMAVTPGWDRSVSVQWVTPSDLTQVLANPTGVKRITVTVAHNTVPVAKLVAVRTAAWPDDQKDDSLKVLFVVKDDGNPSVRALARQARMESWGFVVTRIGASDSESNFDTAVANADVAYVSEEISWNNLGTKLQDALIGVVNEEMELYKVFGFSERARWFTNETDIAILDNTHYVTSPFSSGELAIFSSGQTVVAIDDRFVVAPDLQVLGEDASGNAVPALTVLETGAQLWDGGVAAGRRVQVPWGGDAFDINSLTADGETLMKRAIEWAAKKEQP
ncbi:MAG: hypothetical protein V3U29_04175 [Phycisphaeraceae bacterium]